MNNLKDQKFKNKFKNKDFLLYWLLAFCLFFVGYGGYLSFGLSIKKISDIILSPANESIKATSYLVGEISSGKIFLKKNENLHLYPASLSKLVVAMVVLDNFPLEKEIFISSNTASPKTEKNGLRVGEAIKTKDLLEILLISSSNEAAMAFAEAFQKEGKNIVDLMNQKARGLGLLNSAFFDSSGLDRKANFSTAEDLFKISREIYRNYPHLGYITRQSESTVYSADGCIRHFLTNTNILADCLAFLWLGKTGTTPEAKECLLTIFEFPLKNGKIPIVIIVLNSDNRFSDVSFLYNWMKISLDKDSI